jgi:hypothetical protein
MRAILTLAVAGLLAAAAVAPAAAATKHKRHVRTEAPATQRVEPAPAPIFQTPNACWSDEGYGRFSSCDEGGY